MATQMPRPRKRVRLPERCKLDLNLLRKQGIIRPGATTGPWRVQWTSNHTGETIASGFISASMDGDHEGWFRIQLGSLDQTIILIAQSRHFGGRQWYFSCPLTQRRVSVLWKPPGAHLFSSRHAWARRVGYASQFETPRGRAWRGQRKIKGRLIGNLDPDQWDLPPNRLLKFALFGAVSGLQSLVDGFCRVSLMALRDAGCSMEGSCSGLDQLWQADEIVSGHC